MSLINGRRAHEFLNPFSFSAERIKGNLSQNQNVSNDSKEVSKFLKFPKPPRKGSININEFFLLHNKRIKYCDKDYHPSKIRFNYDNLIKSYHQTHESQPLQLLHSKLQAQQSNSQSNIHININSNYNINTNKMTLEEQKLKQQLSLQKYFKGSKLLLSPLTIDVKREISLKMHLQKTKDEHMKLLTHMNRDNLGGISSRGMSPAKRQEELEALENDKNCGGIIKVNDNDESFINEASELVNNINGYGYKGNNGQRIGPLASVIPRNGNCAGIDEKQLLNRRNVCQTPNDRPQTSYGGMKLRRMKMRCLSKESMEFMRKTNEMNEQHQE